MGISECFWTQCPKMCTHQEKKKKLRMQQDTAKQIPVKYGSLSQTHTSLFIAHRVTFSQRCHQPWNFPSIFCQEMVSCRDKRDIGAGTEGRERTEEVDWLHRKFREHRHLSCSWRELVFFCFFFNSTNVSCLLPAMISRCLTGSLFFVVMCLHRGAAKEVDRCSPQKKTEYVCVLS